MMIEERRICARSLWRRVLLIAVLSCLCMAGSLAGGIWNAAGGGAPAGAGGVRSTGGPAGSTGPAMETEASVLFGSLLAEPVYAASNFVIEDYDIDMQVREDDTYLITETLQVRFTAASHGIYRQIPYRVHLDRDGQESTFFAGISDFNMLSGQPYSMSKSDSQFMVKIGDPDRYADTETEYKFSYVYDMKGDHLKNGDEVYYNLVGTGWEAQSIDRVSFRVTFPKDIDMSKVGMKTGGTGGDSGYDEEVAFETEGVTAVYGETDAYVMNGLTIRAVLPEGYFSVQAGTSNMPFYILIGLLVIMAAAGFLLWRRYGVDPQIVETEEFYPPEGLSAPEVGYLEDGEIKGSHVISMLLSLADKGYLKITEREVAAGLRKKKTKTEYEISQVRDYDGATIGESTFMNALFRHGDRPVVTMSELTDKFYTTVNEIKKMIVAHYRDRMYDAKAGQYARLLKWAGIIGMVALVIASKLSNGSPFITDGDFIVSIVMLLAQIILPIGGFLGIARWINAKRKSVLGYVLGFIGWAILILIGLGLAGLFDTFLGFQFIPYVIGMAMCFIVCILSALCERKTDFYAETLGKIRGFKRFLEVAEKDRMEMLADQDPGYFYRNLAFAYALGVTAVYAKNFAGLATEPPQWYDSRTYGTGSSFDSLVMMNAMDNMMSSMTSSMTSSPSSDGGGGGSFSGGGGAGGGGGGSW